MRMLHCWHGVLLATNWILTISALGGRWTLWRFCLPTQCKREKWTTIYRPQHSSFYAATNSFIRYNVRTFLFSLTIDKMLTFLRNCNTERPPHHFCGIISRFNLQSALPSHIAFPLWQIIATSSNIHHLKLAFSFGTRNYKAVSLTQNS